MVGSLHTRKYDTFLKRLREARKEVGMTQVEVAKALRKTQAFVSRCERGERRVDAVEFVEFLRLYGKSLEYFVPEGRGRRQR